MDRKRLIQDDIREALSDLNDWREDKGFLKKRFTFSNFAESLEFVNKVGTIAEAADHHPDITFGWGYAEIALTTHDRGGVTDVDFALAKQIDVL